MIITPYSLAEKFIGRKEIPGFMDDPMVMQWLRLDNTWPQHDEVPWCSAFANWICWLAGARRTRDLRARSWLQLDPPVPLDAASRGWHIVVLRNKLSDPGPDVIAHRGHVGFYHGHTADTVSLLGGNQGNQVRISRYPTDKVIGVRCVDTSQVRGNTD